MQHQIPALLRAWPGLAAWARCCLARAGGPALRLPAHTGPPTAPCRPAIWQLRPFAGLSASGFVGRLLTPGALRAVRGTQLSQLAVISIAAQAVASGVAQVFRVFRLAGSKQVRRARAHGMQLQRPRPWTLPPCTVAPHPLPLHCIALHHITRRSALPPPAGPQVEHTTMPKREHGHKQLGRGAAGRHLAQLISLFALGAAFLLLAPVETVGQGRVAMATFGVIYALQVRGAHPVNPAWLLAAGRQPGRLGRRARQHAPGGAGPFCRRLPRRASAACALRRAPCPPLAAQATRLIMDHMAKEPWQLAVWPLVAMALQVRGRRRGRAARGSQAARQAAAQRPCCRVLHAARRALPRRCVLPHLAPPAAPMHPCRWAMRWAAGATPCCWLTRSMQVGAQQWVGSHWWRALGQQGSWRFLGGVLRHAASRSSCAALLRPLCFSTSSSRRRSPHPAVVVSGYLHYAISMVAEICAFLGIPCLTVRKVEED